MLRCGKGIGVARYLLAVSPIRGHVMPMVDLGAGLQKLGHDVTVLTGAQFGALVENAGLTVRSLPDSVVIDPPAAAPRWLRSLPAAARRFWLGRAELADVFAEPLAAEADSLRALLRGTCFDAVVADITFTGLLPVLLQDSPRPPVVVCGVGPLTLSSADTPPFGMAWQPEPGVDYRPMTTVAHRVIMRSSQRRFDAALRRAGSGRSPVFISDWPRLADAVLQLSVQEFEYPRSDLPSTVEFVGPVLPDAGRRFVPPPWWPEVTRGDRVVVHVTQGTFDNADLNQLLAPTFDALGGRDDILVVATTGGRSGQCLDRDTSANIHVAEWIPYSVLLPHVDVMITNGGYGGVQYALAHGVPLIVAGETSDKAEVAARVDYSGVGVDLGTFAPSADAIRAAVDRVRGDDRYRAAARRIQAAIDASTPVDSIANALKRCAGA
ncbi:glycosyl transferase [Mycolicibacterium parafortuitum]